MEKNGKEQSPRSRFHLIIILICIIALLAGCNKVSPATETTANTSTGSTTGSTTAPQEEPYLRISLDSGIYDGDSVSVSIEAPEGFHIAYTANGCVPTADDDCGESAVTVTLAPGVEGYLVSHNDQMVFPIDSISMKENPDLPQGRVLYAALLDASGEILLQETRVYFFGADFYDRFPGCLVFSFYTDPNNLLDYYTGILATGAIYDEWSQTDEAKELFEAHSYWDYEANFTQTGKDWERTCLLQIYDGGNSPAVEHNVGIRIRGGISRRFSQKPFNIYFRSDYGSSSLEYELFEGIPTYKSFSLNAGGNNTEWLKFKECFLKSMITDLNLTMLKYRNAVLFINGEYWGPYFVTEKFSDQMFHDHCGVDPDQVIEIKDGEVEVGEENDHALFEALAAFAEKDMADPAIYDQFCEIMDVRSMAAYCALRIYIGDADWRWEKNDNLWRTRDDSYNNGKWQYIPYDMEYSSGLYWMSTTAPETDHFKKALEDYPLLAAALRNGEFRTLFMDFLKKIGSVNFEPGRVDEALAKWDSEWKPLMQDYYLRYSLPPDRWDSSLSAVSNFFRKRYDLLLPKVEEWMAAAETGQY